ncbi:putative disease resistance protein [Citrus sinensis]|uniref:NB-ARC domain-containing protein n=1 Tax=Citrus clementina TaxID=85681 RepID=V4SKN4_CITCL|nr:hypothetical protein CICLE_v10026938mg [Citrus x clementina]KAH9669474.1 putative disease resistance protein [Citrus sinensis]
MASVGDIWNVVKDCFLCSFYLYSNSRDLKDKVDTLSVKKGELQVVYDEVNGRVEHAKQDRDLPRPTVLYWLARVLEYTNENGKVDFLLQRAEEEKAKQCFGYCSVNCFFVYYFSLDVVKVTEDLQGLIDEGKGFKKDVADPPPPQPVVERQDMKNVVGMESILDEVWECFEDDFPMRIICLYGVSGVGKTTLLVNFNSKFSDTRHNFYLVILVKAVDNKNQQGRAEEIFQRLSQRRFALLLDDLRGPINLDEAGVPDQNGSKIVFTTIMEDACNTMGDQIKFKVDYLRRDKNAVVELRNYPAKFPGMGDLILPRLKFSYDHLSTETHKTCFSFCSLFLKNQLIRKDELVDLWIGEGLFRGSHNIVVARMQGKCIIDSLIGVCLLEEVQTSFGNYVKMHDLLRDLALWIASQDEGNKILASKPKNDELIIERQSIT